MFSFSAFSFVYATKLTSLSLYEAQSGVIRYMKNNRSIWETHPIERSRLIFQLGSADPLLAVQAAKVIEQDVAGVGLNCGCPKSFSIQGGMGAALLNEPERLCSVSFFSLFACSSSLSSPFPCTFREHRLIWQFTQILTALSTSLSVPVDAKIRLLPEQSPTLELVKKILKTGIQALTVHCRTRVRFRDRRFEVVEVIERSPT